MSLSRRQQSKLLCRYGELLMVPNGGKGGAQLAEEIDEHATEREPFDEKE